MNLAPGDKQPGGLLSLPPPMASHRLLAGFNWILIRNGGVSEMGKDFRGQDLRGEDLQGAKLRRADLSEADLRGVNMRGAPNPELRDARRSSPRCTPSEMSFP